MGDVYMVNGKILSGLPNHAKDIAFDNTGTTLSSTNTEDAIKEVNSNLTEIKTVTGTLSSTLNQEVYISYPAGFTNSNCIVIGAAYYSSSQWKNYIVNNSTRFDFTLLSNILAIVRSADAFNCPFKITLAKIS